MIDLFACGVLNRSNGIVLVGLLYFVYSLFNSIRAASILFIGLGALAGEVCKNVALAGVRRITLLDDTSLDTEHLRAYFLATHSDVGKPVRFVIYVDLQLTTYR